MDITEIIENRSVILQVTGKDLAEFASDLIKRSKRELEESIASQKKESWLTANQVCDLLSVSMVTLHRWAKLNYLVPVMVGGRRLFSYTEVHSLLQKRTA